MNPVAAVRGAVALLTRIPVGRSPISPEAQSWSPAFFPWVGAALGLLSWVIFHGAQPLGAFAAATLTIAVAVLVTGAFHEDGLADSADGLFGAVSRERALEIMKDSRIGTYGAVALSLSLLLRVALVARLEPHQWLPLVFAPCLGRLGPVWLLTHVCHAAPTQSKTKDLTAIGRSRAWVATAMTLLLCVGFVLMVRQDALRIAVAWVVAAVVTVYVGRLALRRLGGITGDLLGACEQLGELAILGVFAADLRGFE